MKPGDVSGLVIAKVTAVDDRERLGRVKVSFPWLDEEMTTDWISIVAPFAGGDRGVFFMPEVNDEVVVGFFHGDFNQPCVLGAMWNGRNVSPSPDPRQRMIRSKNGHTIRFVDSTEVGGDKGALIIHDAHDNVISLTNSYMLISAKGVLVIEADQIQIRQRGGEGWRRIVEPNSNSI